MRVLLGCLVLAACATPASQDDGVFAPGLEKYEHLFHGVPANGSLPDIGKADAVYPAKSTELLRWQSPIKDQNRRGVCSIFATTALMEHLYLKAGAQSPSFSEQYLQWSVKVQLGRYPNGEGSNVEDNIEAINTYGIVTETDDPYNGLQWTAANDPDCMPDGTETQELPTKCWTQGDPPASAIAADHYFLPEGQYINTADIKAHITQDHTAVAVGIDFFYQAWNHGLSTLPINRDDMRAGIVRYPNNDDVTESHKQRAGHAILIVGWDDELEVPAIDKDGKQIAGQTLKGFYIFKNSWGTDIFGVTNPNGAGYGYISEKYIEEYGTAYTSGVPTSTAGVPPGMGSGSGDPPPPPPPPPSCQYNCADYGYAANECMSGWQCDAQGTCLTPTASGSCP